MLWSEVRGDGSPTVVFEAGGGEDSSVWAELEPDVRRSEAVQTFVYDRAGLGRSAPTEPPYRIDDEAEALRQELDRHGIAAPVVLVAHSYGGFVATLVAAADERIAGVVLVDANLASFMDDAQLEKLLATYRPQYAALEQAEPELARVMIPLMEAYPATVERLRAVDIPRDIPTIDIVAERTWVETPQEVEAFRRAHAEFVAGSPQRESVFAEGSGHHVMHDRPDLVLDAVARVIAKVRAAG
jgi:pimeloyl-ACP methyl ester carboxylesterase